MLRYFFDIRDGDRVLRDETGVELDGIERVEQQAARALSDMARDTLPCGAHHDFVVNMRDDGGRPVLRASLSFNVVRFVYP
jgi:hypothetical protein